MHVEDQGGGVAYVLPYPLPVTPRVQRSRITDDRVPLQPEEVMSNRKGFTLIELLIVVVIIGILAAIAIPKFANTKEKAVVAGMKSDLRNLVTAQEGFFSDNVTYATGFAATQANAGSSPTCGGSVAFSPTTGNVLAISGTCTAAGWAATI